jgi:putative hydrolase of the HAD superfamily
METNILLLDADGVVIKNHEYFSVRYIRDYGNLYLTDTIVNWFKTTYKDCAIGEKDLKEELSSVIHNWGWQGSVDELMEYWFSGERELDNDVLQIVSKLNQQGAMCCLASDNEPYRARYLDEQVGLNNFFQFQFYSGDIGFTKSQPEFFDYIVNVLRVPAEEILYFDDDPQNVAIANNLGIIGHHFTAPADIESVLNRL